jgi:hypothetical protein
VVNDNALAFPFGSQKRISTEPTNFHGVLMAERKFHIGEFSCGFSFCFHLNYLHDGLTYIYITFVFECQAAILNSTT